MAEEKALTDITDLARQTQALFKLDGAVAPQLEQVMKVQEGMLEQAGIFTRHWIERRQQAVDTALEALNQMNSKDEPDPAAAMQAIADWQRGSVERLNADLRDWMTLCTQTTQLVVTAQTDAASSDANQRKATRAKGRAASSGSRSDHATPV